MFTDFLHDFSFSSFFINKYRPRNIMNNDHVIFPFIKYVGQHQVSQPSDTGRQFIFILCQTHFERES